LDFELDPILRSARDVPRAAALRNDAFEPEPTGMVEDERRVFLDSWKLG
jgi:hypothetical protein